MTTSVLDWCHMKGVEPVTDLKSGMDFRNKECRREVFLRFYEFHLKYRAHPGLVYQFIPHLKTHFGWSREQALWYASLNALTQHAMTSLALFKQLPAPPANESEMGRFDTWFNANWHSLPFDVDRRYQKVETPRAIWRLACKIKEYGSIEKLYTGSFAELWDRVRNELHSLGRLGAFSGLEFVKIAGADFEFDTMFLRDRDGSKSHRNGLCIVLGFDELDWHSKLNPTFDGKYTEKQYDWLEQQGEVLLNEAVQRFAGRSFGHDVGYQTLESTLCCYKSWHRPNRRYPLVYADMSYGRLLDTRDKNPTLDLTPFYNARRFYLPEWALPEADRKHPHGRGKALNRKLQNLYRETGQIPFMGYDWECFKYNVKLDITHMKG